MIRRSTFLKDQRGATAIEYGLIAALVSVVIVGALTSTGSGLKSNFDTWSSAVGGAVAN